jgi:peptide/nickel transport system ATP-binding protein
LKDDAPLLEVRGLKKYFPIHKGIMGRVMGQIKAVDDVSFEIRPGETFGLVGESGCGKTTVGRTILRLIEPTAGKIIFRRRNSMTAHGEILEINVECVPRRRIKHLRRDMQIIYQDPYSSLNPRMTVGEIIGEPLLVHGVKNQGTLSGRVRELLAAVGLKSQHMNRYPHEFSGGQRQRIGIARALALHPRLIVADEPVSALDVSVQAQVLNLLVDLQEEFGLTYLFIAHDLSVVRHISTRVAVMYLGYIVESAPTEELFKNPRHPYTEALMSAVPVLDPDHPSGRIKLKGEIGNPANPPPGCRFHPRCTYAQKVCRSERPQMQTVDDDHYTVCHFAESLNLQPAWISNK